MSMPAKTVLPFGTWPSPITAQIAARGSRRFGMIQAVGDALYWSESRPEQGGRQTILCAAATGPVKEVLPAPFSARSRVHEYGGGEFLATGATLYFVNDKDQQIYALDAGRKPRALTEHPSTRFADLAHDAARRRLIAVAEIHTRGEKLPRNVLVSLPLSGHGRTIDVRARGRDFYATPRLSPDGAQIAFLAWDLPDMPWDSAALYVAAIEADGSLGRPRRIAGGEGSAVFQPEWGLDGHLYFVGDESGWGQLYRWRDGAVASVHGKPGAELFRPQWVFGARSYALQSDGRIGTVSLERGSPLFEVIGAGTTTRPVTSAKLKTQTARIDDPIALGDGFAALVSTPKEPPALMRLTKSALAPVSPAAPLGVDTANLSEGEVIEFRGGKRRAVYGFYFPPLNARCRAPAGTAPPALIFVHGGPTSMTDRGLKLRTQFFTSRGFAVFDLNYSGSTGYGRAYRERLDGAWGIADVADCVAAARHLAKAGLANPRQIAISGGSAGGYTTLMALAATKSFAAGSCHYGVSDLALLLKHTHKFESGYLHRLMGTTSRSWRETFAQRSPLTLIEGVTAPVILFQGLDDKVVPPEQSRLMVEKLKARGVEVEYHEFAGEAHGFRKAETIIAVLDAELAFLRRVLRLR
jgi:dipeptidyl aminopeptidase/acylaminoacyl peptidase